MKKKYFPASRSNDSLPKMEEAILKFWKKENIFQRTIDSRSPHNNFVFFDGPPFATGKPHYGHILASTIKDAIPRYKTMQGYRVTRNWGWDCHGVPVEYQVETEHRIGGKPEIEKMGVGKFNELCRSIVLRCREDWRDTVDRMGRFVDFENDYKTMDPEFMESVWWVFGELWKKDLVYEGYKVVPYSPKLGSPLSNFEANLNYKDIDDPAVTVGFELMENVEGRMKNKENAKTYLLAWTTTPWTLPSNLGLVVHPKMEYAKVVFQKDIFIVLKNLAEKIFKDKGEIIGTLKGKDLIGASYKPLFDFYVGKKGYENAWRIMGDDFVSEEEGTGVVHMAPTGEDDARILTAHNVPLHYPFDDNGFFDDTMPPLKGLYFREDPTVESSKENNANKWVLENLGDKLFKREQVRHSYPHCWRSECALMYRGVHTWFVNVGKLKKQMIAENKKINWIPAHLRDGRFGKMLEMAPDWAISRSRYWGTPLPVWRCDKCDEVQVVTSRTELEKLSGKKVKDLHRHFVDDLNWKCEKCEKSAPLCKGRCPDPDLSGEEQRGLGIFRRIPEVLDCWFESGAMPYASIHYPFTQKEFQPADFIAEGLDQTRGWFYTLHVLGTALFGKPIFKNVITNGIVLAEDGTKMSKSKKNYPDPSLVFHEYGADAMRFYLLSSPVARGENLRFTEHGVEEVLKSVLLPLRSTYQFFSTYANIDGWKPTKFIYSRHGESDSNVKGFYSGKRENAHHLTAKGKKDIQALAQRIDDFDVLVSSPFIRTKETAEIYKKEKKFSGEILIDERLREIEFGGLEGKPVIPALERMRHKEVEPVSEIIQRMRSAFDDMSKTYQGKTVLVVSHGGPIRELEASLNNLSEVEDIVMIPMAQTGTVKTFFASPESKNELDQWILSQLQSALGEFSAQFDAYNLEGALQVIPSFIDQLNNWYLRRSRRRFWASGIDADKQSAYQTLHCILLTLAKILAPVCPFFAEKLFKDLGGGESVHLEYFPHPHSEWVNKKLEKKVLLEREIVSLAASIRARAKIKLRQPLGTLRFITTEKSSLDLDIIREEANVKNVEVLKSVKGLAERVVRVDAKKVGPRLGGKVQELIQKGKSGDFEIVPETAPYRVQIAGELLEPDEFEFGFVCQKGVEAEATPRTVVLLDTEITEDLKLEGIARELIRMIQEMRKDKNFEVSDRISVRYETTSKLLRSAFETFREMISTETLTEEIIRGESPDLTEAVDIEGEKVVVEVSKM
ncbi:class I tRNA ligase family protein [Candidatus Gracilibacteria bacterium]|nr:class I tRNA ligase family protein [Candidatus Gracilibacteria bacterium]